MTPEQILQGHPLIPVVSIKDENDIHEKLSVLIREGFTTIELTLRSADALSLLASAIKTYPDATFGAGTVLSPDQAGQAINAGARFVVSPGLSEAVAKVCKARKIPYIPGCVTPTEIMKALSLNLHVIKFFPADVYGGVKALKALSAPFPQVRFMPTGGIDESSLKDYLSFDRVLAVGGSFMMKGDMRENCKRLSLILQKGDTV